MQRRDGHVLAACARNLLDQVNFDTGAQMTPAVHIADVTDPRHPTTVEERSMPVDPLGGVGCLPVEFAHSARFEGGGNSLYVSYWDAETVHLDIHDPSAPSIVADVVLTADEDRDNNSMTLARGGRWLIINPEGMSPRGCGSGFGGWGEAWVYDDRDPAHPMFLGAFATPDTLSTRSDGLFDVHNTEVWHDNQLMSSWYSDGVVWWSMDDQGVGRQLGQFVPPPSARVSVPLVWGVAPLPRRRLVLASDMGSGLWIVRPTGGHG